jgi:hypothetical protein
MEDNAIFDGFMPHISNITISPITSSISGSGDLVPVHCVTIFSGNGDKYIFSISPGDLQRLFFLVLKAID